MIITKTIKEDLWIRDWPQEIHAVQGDTATRRIVVKLFANREPWYPPENVCFALRYRKPDGTGGTYDTLPNGEKAWELTENAVSFLLAPQMLEVPGQVKVQAELFAGNSVLASFSFYVLVEENVAAGAVKSRNYFNWVQRLEEKLKEKLKEAKDSGIFDGQVGTTPKLQIGKVTTLAAGEKATAAIGGTPENPILDLGLPKGDNAAIDATLSLSGQAADAAAVGTALAGKAPAGYGLGGASGKLVADFNNANENGWYYGGSGTINYPPDHAVAEYGAVFVIARNENDISQLYFNYNGAKVLCMRTKEAGVWGEWEYVNPSTVVGVEYRTTERWNDKPVYTQLVNFGALPNNTVKAVTITASGVTDVVDYNARYSDGANGAVLYSGGDVISSYALQTNKILFSITAPDNSSGFSVMLQIKYVK